MPDLIMASYGEPEDPSTWSGTPANLIAALRRQGLDVVGLDYSRAVPALERKLRGLTREVRRRLPGAASVDEGLRTRAARTRSAEWVARQAERLGCANVLHTGTLALPMRRVPVTQRHYLYTDTTWHLWASQSPEAGSLDPVFVRRSDDLERRAYQQVEHIFPIGAYVVPDLVEHYGVPERRITPVGTGLNAVRPFNGAKDYTSGLILSAARVRSSDKGVGLLAHAFRIARRTRPGLRLVIVGSEANAALVGDVENVEITGFVPREQLQRLFESATIFAMPALNEPWGLVYLEAMACKTPVLGLRRNALPEMTDDGRLGFLVDDPSPERLSEALLDALGDQKRLESMGNAAQERVLSTYSWDLTAKRIAERITRS
ncbi:MAG: glycosyltransferase family 4 protein [Aeromicrobium sp.]|nr:glycosyltransferase family 4 protein [Aeromicrobium sp.]